jgi:hypothetical protein
MGTLDKGMTHIPEGWSRTVGDFITSLRMPYNLKLTKLFWNFPLNIFGPWFAIGNN